MKHVVFFFRKYNFNFAVNRMEVYVFKKYTKELTCSNQSAKTLDCKNY